MTIGLSNHDSKQFYTFDLRVRCIEGPVESALHTRECKAVSLTTFCVIENFTKLIPPVSCSIKPSWKWAGTEVGHNCSFNRLFHQSQFHSLLKAGDPRLQKMDQSGPQIIIFSSSNQNEFWSICPIHEQGKWIAEANIFDGMSVSTYVCT
jgi:hypothetical protein